MGMRSTKETSINIGAVLTSAVFVAIVYLTIWTVRALILGQLFPPVPERRVPWNGWQLVVLVLTVQFLLPSIVYMAARQTGLLEHIIQPSRSDAVDDSAPAQDDASQQSLEIDSLERERSSLWLAVVTFPFQVATIIGFLTLVSRARLSDMGLTESFLGRNLLLGVIGWVLLAPAVLVLNVGVNLLHRGLLQVRVEEHPMMRLMQAESNSLELGLMVFTAVVAAPFLEELLFRGVLQPWFAQGRDRGLIALGAALLLATIQRCTPLELVSLRSGVAPRLPPTEVRPVLGVMPQPVEFVQVAIGTGPKLSRLSPLMASRTIQ